MHTRNFIFLLTYLTSLSLTIPPPRPNYVVTCFNGADPQPHADDCIHVLEAVSNLRWAWDYITFGRDLPGPGRLPYIGQFRTCRFTLNTDVVMTAETGTFRLVEYFPSVYQIIQQCFRQERTYREGVVDVGGGHKFHVRLSGFHLGNETAVGTE